MVEFLKSRFRKDRNAWFVTINGRRYELDPKRDAAYDRFHDLMPMGSESDNVKNTGLMLLRLTA